MPRTARRDTGRWHQRLSPWIRTPAAWPSACSGGRTWQPEKIDAAASWLPHTNQARHRLARLASTAHPPLARGGDDGGRWAVVSVSLTFRPGGRASAAFLTERMKVETVEPSSTTKIRNALAHRASSCCQCAAPSSADIAGSFTRPTSLDEPWRLRAKSCWRCDVWRAPTWLMRLTKNTVVLVLVCHSVAHVQTMSQSRQCLMRMLNAVAIYHVTAN